VPATNCSPPARRPRRRGCAASWASSGCCSRTSTSRPWGRRASSSSATTLAPASGFQSVQFRRIEWISGLRDAFPADASQPEGPALYEAFCTCAALPAEREARLQALADLYRDHEGDPARAALYDVAELLVDHDEGIALWRHHHVLMAAREIGSRPGAGGSPGVPYLETTLERRFFPDLGT